MKSYVELSKHCSLLSSVYLQLSNAIETETLWASLGCNLCPCESLKGLDQINLLQSDAGPGRLATRRLLVRHSSSRRLAPPLPRHTRHFFLMAK